ncbi:MAG TPA: hypothetical protein VGH65_10855 [Verrucomicrobiaceae bacterium]|jgi:hypothetical protein
MIDSLIDLISAIWRADTDLREGSLLGQSELDKESGRFVAWLSGGLITLLTIAGILWWWISWRIQS